MRKIYASINFITLALLFSCASPHFVPEHQGVHLISNVPFYPQEDYQCGPASLASVLSYWNRNADPEEIGKEIFSKPARGTLTIDMVLYAQKSGLHAQQFSGNMEALRSSIDSFQPLIVLVDYGISAFQRNHFMVVTGYTNDGVIVHSGKEQNKFLPEKNFLAAWKKTGYWTLLIKKQ